MTLFADHPVYEIFPPLADGPNKIGGARTVFRVIRLVRSRVKKRMRRNVNCFYSREIDTVREIVPLPQGGTHTRTRTHAADIFMHTSVQHRKKGSGGRKYRGFENR